MCCKEEVDKIVEELAQAIHKAKKYNHTPIGVVDYRIAKAIAYGALDEPLKHVGLVRKPIAEIKHENEGEWIA